ncbi:hypothetical protein RPALISO_135 [Ruegeria phage RpAliso]|nr:hypothetical protein RPALISO_135 [Ruegeria phage RpAliso]
MLSKWNEKAREAYAAAKDKASKIDLSSVTGKLAEAKSRAAEIAEGTAAGITDRFRNPADAYDIGIDNMVKVATSIESFDAEDLEGLTVAANSLKEGNPYR